MIIFFDPDTLHHHHVVFTVDTSDTSLWDHLPNWVEVHHSAGNIHHLKMQVTRAADGTIGVRHTETGAALPIVRRLAKLSVSAVTEAKVGDVLRLEGIPLGAEIFFQGKVVSVMSESDGVIEVTPREAGLHQFQFRLNGYKPQTIAIEVAA